MELKSFFYDYTEFLKDVLDFIQSEIQKFEFKITKISNFIEYASLEFIVDDKYRGELFYNSKKELLEAKIVFETDSFKTSIKIDGSEEVYSNLQIKTLTKEIESFLNKLNKKPNKEDIINFFKLKTNVSLSSGNNILSFEYKETRVEISFLRNVIQIKTKPNPIFIKMDTLESAEELYQKIIETIDSNNQINDSEYLFESKNNYEIIDISGSDDQDFEITLENGEILESSDLFYDLSQIFDKSKVRILSIEKPHEVAITEDGIVIGGSVLSKEMPNEDDYDSGIRSVVRFSIAVDDSYRKLGVATKLIKNIIAQYHRHGTQIQAQVINPLMEELLIKLGFEKISDSGSAAGLVYQL